MMTMRPIPLFMSAVAGLVLTSCAPDNAMKEGPKTAVVQKPRSNGDPLAKVLVKVGAKAAAAKQFATAVNFYERAHELDPGSTAPLLGIAAAYRQAGHPRDASASYAQVLDLDPQNMVAMRELNTITHELVAAKAEAKKVAESNEATTPMASTKGTATAEMQTPHHVTAEPQIASAGPTILGPATQSQSASSMPESQDPLLRDAAQHAGSIDGGKSWASDAAAPAEAPRMTPREGYEKVAQALQLAAARKRDGDMPAPSTAGHAEAEGYRVQIAAYKSRAHAETRMQGIEAAAAGIDALRLVVMEADLGDGKGMVYRLRTTPVGDRGAADNLCAALKSRSIDCFVVSPPAGSMAMKSEKSDAAAKPAPGERSAARSVDLVHGSKSETRKLGTRWIQEDVDDGDDSSSGDSENGVQPDEDEGGSASMEGDGNGDGNSGGDASDAPQGNQDASPAEKDDGYVPDTAGNGSYSGESDTAALRGGDSDLRPE